jgi:hypothetical protein
MGDKYRRRAVAGTGWLADASARHTTHRRSRIATQKATPSAHTGKTQAAANMHPLATLLAGRNIGAGPAGHRVPVRVLLACTAD